MSISAQISTINVPFHGASLYIVNHNGEPFVPMRPVVEGMGMVWAAQFVKLKQRFESTVSEIEMVALDGKRREMTCLAFRKFAAWLTSIQPNKVKPEIRDRVIQYQDECDDVLYEYWTKGEVVNPRKAKKAHPGKISADQQEAIKQLVMTRGKALPKEKQAKAMITMWSALKTHFGVTYKEIAEDQFTEALSLAARVPIEGEFIGKESLPSPKQNLSYPITWWHQHNNALKMNGGNVFSHTDQCRFPLNLLFGFADETPSAIRSLIEELTLSGHDMSAVKIEFLAHRHFAETMNRKLRTIGGMFGAKDENKSVGLRISPPMKRLQ